MDDQNKKSLMEQFHQVYSVLYRFQGFLQHSEGRGVGNPHRGQGRVLSLLKLQPEISQKELGYLLDMRNQSLGELLIKLEKKGFITRTPSEQDRRTMNIKLTEAGLEAAGETEEKQHNANQLFSCLSEEEQEKLSELLGKLEAGLEVQFEEIFRDHLGKMGGHRRGHPFRPRPPERPPFGGESGPEDHHRGPQERPPRFVDFFGGYPYEPQDGRYPGRRKEDDKHRQGFGGEDEGEPD